MQRGTPLQAQLDLFLDVPDGELGDDISSGSKLRETMS
jgi:hypothetical protein